MSVKLPQTVTPFPRHLTRYETVDATLTESDFRRVATFLKFSQGTFCSLWQLYSTTTPISSIAAWPDF